MTDALLQSLKEKGLYRKRQVYDRQVLKTNFSSNDYLSLANDKQLAAAFQRGFELYPSGSSSSMAVCGYFPIHKTVETSFASFLKAEEGLLFSSGYAANLAVVSLLAKLEYQLFIDKGIHASFYDGIQLGRAQYRRFLHNDFEDLQKKLPKDSEKKIVAVEGIYSMSGQKPNLSLLTSICKVADTLILVDEGHSFGVVGPEGAGATAEHALSIHQVPLRIIPFGKALAAQGAMVVGQAVWVDALFQVGRSAIYSTGLSPALAYGVLSSLDLVIKAESKRQALAEAILYFKNKIQNSSFIWRKSQTAIQQLQLGCPHKAQQLSAKLLDKGILCLPMREPTVNRKDTGLRLVLNANHEPTDIDALFTCLEAIKEEGLGN